MEHSKMSNYDRFNSREEIVFDRKAEKQGYMARLRGEQLSNNPYPPGWAHRSWNAGWADADMAERIERAEKT